MPKYDVEIELSGTWSAEIVASSVEEARQLALKEFEAGSSDSILAFVEPMHPNKDEVYVYFAGQYKELK